MAENQETNTSVNEVRKSIDSTNDVLKKQIDNVEIRQQELQNLISNLESNVNVMTSTISAEKKKSKPDYNVIKGCQTGLTRNLELLAKYYEVYRQFEEAKFKYHNVINDNVHKGMKLIHVDIRRIDKDLDKRDSQDFASIMAALKSGLQESQSRENLEKESQEIFDEDAKYKI